MKLKQKWTRATDKSINPVPEYKQCEGENCTNRFKLDWPNMRRCKRCRREKRPYRKEDNPF